MKPSQCQQILDYMRRFGSINPLQALYDIGCFRLAPRIFDLKKKGYLIISKRVNYITRLGEAKHFNEYILKEDQL